MMTNSGYRGKYAERHRDSLQGRLPPAQRGTDLNPTVRRCSIQVNLS